MFSLPEHGTLHVGHMLKTPSVDVEKKEQYDIFFCIKATTSTTVH